MVCVKLTTLLCTYIVSIDCDGSGGGDGGGSDCGGGGGDGGGGVLVMHLIALTVDVFAIKGSNVSIKPHLQFSSQGINIKVL